MPYRRLPNTDVARIRAMQKALQKTEGIPPFNLPFSVSIHQELKYFFPEFKQALQFQKEAQERQYLKHKKHQESFKKARLYVSHFIQVLNFAIIRGELKPETRAIFGLDEDERKLPLLNSEKDLIEWGDRLIKGEYTRLTSGQTPITNPTIARVKVHYEDFLKIHQSQKHLQETHTKSAEKIVELRNKADLIIAQLWNEIEDNFSDLPAEEKREQAEKYGLVYVFRKNERLLFRNLKLGVVK
ncbi:MAG: hypothetical protein AB7E36_02305 [Salinivirgaceae bacterium]